MENLKDLKYAFNNLVKSVKNDIEKAFSKQNIEEVMKPLTKVIKTAEYEINEYLENIKFTSDDAMKMNILPTQIKKTPKPLPKITQIKKTPKPLPKITRTEVEGEQEVKIIKKIVNSTSKLERLIQFNKLKRQVSGKRVVIRFIMDSGLEHDYTFSKDFLGRVEKLISGEKKTETFGSDSELYGIFLNDGIVDVKVFYLEEGLRDKGAFLPFYHTMDRMDLRIIQIRRNAQDLIGVFYLDKMNSDEEIKKIKEQELENYVVSLKEIGFDLDDKYIDISTLKEKDNTLKEVIKQRTLKIADHCLIHSLKVLGCDLEKIELVKEYIGTNSFKTKDLNSLAAKLNCRFKLTVLSHDEKSGQSKQFGSKEVEEEYHLVLYRGHYMPNVEFKITQYAVRYYDEIKEFRDWQSIRYIQKKGDKKIPQRVKEPSIDTIKLISAMDSSNKFYWDESIHESTEFRHEFSTSKLTPQIVENCQRRVKPIIKDDVDEEYIFVGDFESIVNKVSVHKAFLLGCVSLDGKYKRAFKATKENLDDNKIFTDMLSNLITTYASVIEKENKKEQDTKKLHNKLINKNLTEADKWKLYKKQNDEIIETADDVIKKDLEEKNEKVDVILKNLHDEYRKLIKSEENREKGGKDKPKFIIYFHNLKYDYSLIQACQNFIISSECSKSGNIYSATLKYKGYTFELRDSYKMISMPLRDFQKSLDLKNGKKDFAIYEYFTPDNFTNEFATLEELQKHDKKLTIEKLKKRGLEQFLTEDKKNLHVIDFYVDYMMADCDTTAEGLKKFNELMLKQIGLNSFNFLTISSIAHCYFVNNCYSQINDKNWGIDENGNVIIDGLGFPMYQRLEETAYELCGTLREFVARANVGGRTCLQNNKKVNRTSVGLKEFIEMSNKVNDVDNTNMRYDMNEFKKNIKKIQDFDGVSLYPSAMAISVIPAGACNVFSEDILRKLEDYFKKHIEKIEKLKNLEISPVEMIKVKKEQFEKITDDELKQSINRLRNLNYSEDDIDEYFFTKKPDTSPKARYKRVVSELNKKFKLKTIENETQLLQHYLNAEHFVVEVLLEVEGDQQIPFLCGEDEDGTRDWTNSVSGSVVMNKIDLINLPKYYTIKKLQIIQGVYWMTQIGMRQKTLVQEYIKKLFEARAKAKREGNNGLQNMLKLFMNSAYGKTNVKAAKSNIRYVARKDVDAFKRNNYEYIKCITYLNNSGSKFDRVRIKLSNNTYEHFNLAHIAGVYLSNSKVIMNDLLNVFTQEGKEALYTDTDSIHMFDEDIPTIEKKYREIYGRELIGKSLGQFHDDFEPIIPKFNNGVKISKKERKAYPQYSIGFIGLGKKSYLDVLANDFNDDINYHIRFKGANSANIEAYCKTQKITIVEFYEKLFRGEKVRLNLCAGKTRFDYDEKGRVFTKKEFYRCFDFLTKEEKAATQAKKKSVKDLLSC